MQSIARPWVVRGVETLIGTFIAAAFLSGCASAPRITRDAERAQLPDAVTAALAAANLPQDALSVVVRRVKDGRDLLSMNSDRASSPGSVMKLVTTYAALELLGPTFRPATRLVSFSAPVGETVSGDVTLVGGGSADFDHAALREMLMRLRQSGVRALSGNLVLDRSLFAPQRTDVGVTPFDASPEFGYNVIPDALLLQSNLLSYRISSTRDVISVTLAPALPGVRVVSELQLNDAACADWENTWKIPTSRTIGETVEVVLSGAFPRDCTRVLSLNAIERDEVVSRSFRRTWTELGGVWTGQVRNVTMASDVAARAPTLLAEHLSRPLSELVRAVNKPSDNVQARLLFNLLGAKARRADETTFAASNRVLKDWLRSKGVAEAAFVFENGSGLSRSEKVPSAQLATLLQKALESPWAPELIASLPIAGLDGTLRTRLRESPAAANARLKTGTLRDVVAVAGYLTDAAGERLIVVAMLNHPSASHAVGRPVVDALIDAIARANLSAR